MNQADPGSTQLRIPLPDARPLITYASPEAVPTRDLTTIKVQRRDTEDRPVLTFKGRAAWALGKLVHAGREGCTPITHPGPRWSHYVWLLKRDGGLDIETVHEAHGPPFEGHHARYVLRTPLEVLEIQEAGDRR